MSKLLVIGIALLILFVSSETYAEQKPLKQGVSFAASDTISPYFYSQQPGGIQYDLLQHALGSNEMYISRVSLASNRRALRLVLSRQEDCIVNAPENIPGLHYTRSLNEYQNSIFTLTTSQLEIDEVKDLELISLLGFQNASKFLGADFKNAARNNPHYSEIANQKSQIFMLFTGRVQAIVLEKKIFYYYRDMLAEKVNTNLSIDEFEIFPKAPRRIACRNKTIAKKIDVAIKEFRATPHYHTLLNAQ